VFLLFKLFLLPLWLPLKLLAELVEHSGHRRHHRRYDLRVNWTPGRAGLARWTNGVFKELGGSAATPVQRFVLRPLAMLAVGMIWLLTVYAWFMWWVILVPVLVLVSLS